MPLRKQHASLPFVRGLDQGGNDPKASAGLARADNVVVNRRGAMSKRFGKTQVGSTEYTDHHLGVHKGRPIIFGNGSVRKADGASVNSSSSFDQMDTLLYSTDISSDVLVAENEMMISTYNINLIAAPEVVVAGDVTIATYVRAVSSSYSLNVRVFDTNSKQLLDSKSVLTKMSANPRTIVLTAQSHAFVFFCDGSFNFAVMPISLTTGVVDDTWTLDLTAITGYTEVDSAVPIDACKMDDDTVGTVFKERGTDDMVVGQVTFSGSHFASSSVQQYTKTNLEYVACCRWTATEMLVVHHEESAAPDREVLAACYDTSGISVGPEQVVAELTDDESIGQITCIEGGGIGKGWIFWTQNETDNTDDWYDGTLHRARFNEAMGTASVDESETLAGHCSIWCKPFFDSTETELFIGVHSSHSGGFWTGTGGGDGLGDPLARPSDPQRMLCLLARCQTIVGADETIQDYLYTCGKWFIGTADQLGLQNPASRVYKAPVTCVTDSEGEIGSGATTVIAAGLEMGEDLYGSSLAQKSLLHQVTIDIAVDQVTDFETRNETILPGSMPSLFDGKEMRPQGLPMAPPAPVLAASGTGSNFKAAPAATPPPFEVKAGLHTYACHYEITDNNGNVWRSPMSPFASVTVTDGQEVDVTFRHHRMPVQGNVYVAVYRSWTAGVKDLRRWLTYPSGPASGVSDTVTDDGVYLANNGQEYSLAGAVLGDDQPPPYRIATVYQDRIFVVHRQFEDRLIRFSKEQVEGYGHGFPPSFYINVTPEYGAITALEAMDDKLIIFKRDAVMALSGSGPNDAGEHYQYSAPYFLAEGIGCKTTRSVVATPAGVMFESDDSIMILRRNGGVEPVGRTVKTLTDASSIRASVAEPRTSSVFFFLENGKTLVYNYLFNVWTVWTNCAGDDAVVVDGVLYFKLRGSAVQGTSQEIWFIDENASRDNVSTWVTMRVRTALINLAGLFRSKRLWDRFLEGYAHAPCKLTVRTAYEGDPVWVDEQTFYTDDLQSWDYDQYFEDTYESEDSHLDKNMTYRWRGSRTRVEQFVQFEIEDAADDSMIAYWKMDGATGDNERDQVGSLDLLKVGSPTGETGKFGGARDLAAGYLQSDGDETVLELQTFTVACWCIANGGASGPAYILNKRRTALAADYTWRIDGHGGTGSNKQPVAQIYLDDDSVLTLAHGSDLSNAWHLISLVFDAARAVVELWVDGELSASASTIGRTINHGSSKIFEVGTSGAPDYFMDLVGFWNQAKNKAWQESTYNAGTGRLFQNETAWEVGRGVTLNALGFVFGVDQRHGSRIGSTRWPK